MLFLIFTRFLARLHHYRKSVIGAFYAGFTGWDYFYFWHD